MSRPTLRDPAGWRVLFAAALSAAVACSSGNSLATTTSANGDVVASTSRANRVAVLEELLNPECARYDPDQDVWFISNMNGGPNLPDSNGYIVRASAADPTKSKIFAQSGANGVHLDAPKGMAIQGDTLWVVDLTALRGFNKRTGAPVATIDFSSYSPKFLNDITVGPDGALYMTETGVVITPLGTMHPGPDRIYKIGPGHAISIAAEGDTLNRPNGIVYDSTTKSFVVVGFAPLYSRAYAWQPGTPPGSTVGTGPGQFDGAAVLPDGSVLVSAWSDSTVHRFSKGKDEPVIKNALIPAAIGLDPKRMVVAVPESMSNRVEFYAIPRWEK